MERLTATLRSSRILFFFFRRGRLIRREYCDLGVQGEGRKGREKARVKGEQAVCLVLGFFQLCRTACGI